MESLKSEKGVHRPYFLWDYDLGERDIKEILSLPDLSVQKRWLMARILTQARFDDVWSYLTLDQIREALPSLRLPSNIRRRWEYALARWDQHATD
ncbi:MAG: hypothetical protein HYS07_02535 [Chlamydiae bacterium]|nr:hypothetical protein [Chlamydiota bacterium]MBI3276932.1 hypothetical protein [Chlamydiota bacterium]